MLFNNGCSALHFPLLESVQIEKAPVKIYWEVQRRNIHKAEHTKVIWKREREKGGRRVRNQEWFNKKVHVGTYHQKEGCVCVCVCTLLSELIAMGILALLWVKSPKRACQCIEYFSFVSATFIFFIHLFTYCISVFFFLQFGQLIRIPLTRKKLKNMLIPAVESRTRDDFGECDMMTDGILKNKIPTWIYYQHLNLCDECSVLVV